MIHSIDQTVRLYFREKTLRALGVFFFSCVLLTFIPGMIERMFSFRPLITSFQSAVIMLAVWMAFLIGIIVKRQFADHRASLLPGYRGVHALSFALVFAALVITGFGWSFYLAQVFHAGADLLLAVVAPSIFIAVICIVLGYFSAAWLVFCMFIVFCLFSDPIYTAMENIFGAVSVNILTLGIAVILLAAFFKRLQDVRDESWEYPYLFSWSQRQNFAGRNANWEAATQLLVVLRRLLGFRNDLLITSSYSSARGLWARVMHWECLKWENYKLAAVLLAILTPFYIFYICLVPGHFLAILNGHLKYFLLGIYPGVLSVGLNQKALMHWGYELTKPVSRERFIREKGTAMLVEIGLYWLLALIFVMVIPCAVLDGARLVTVRFWAEMFLTLTFALTSFGWISALRGATSTRTVLSLAGLGALSGYQFYTLPSAELTGVIAAIVIWLLAGVLLCRIAYRTWIDAEFN